MNCFTAALDCCHLVQVPELDASSAPKSKIKSGFKRGFFGKAAEKTEAAADKQEPSKVRPAWVEKCSNYGSDVLKGVDKAEMRKRIVSCLGHKDAKASDVNGGANANIHQLPATACAVARRSLTVLLHHHRPDAHTLLGTRTPQLHRLGCIAELPLLVNRDATRYQHVSPVAADNVEHGSCPVIANVHA